MNNNLNTTCIIMLFRIGKIGQFDTSLLIELFTSGDVSILHMRNFAKSSFTPSSISQYISNWQTDDVKELKESITEDIIVPLCIKYNVSY